MTTPDISLFSMSREQRNAVFAAVTVLAIAFVNLTQILTAVRVVNLTVVVEIATFGGLMLVSVISMVRSFHGKVEQPVWMLLTGIVITAAIWTALRQDVGLPFGILAAILASVIGTLALPLNKADLALLFGYVFGSLIVVFDAYAGNLYTRLTVTPEVVQTIRALAGFSFIFQILLLIFQSRSIGLGTKIANAISTITLLVSVLLGTMSITIIRNAVTEGGVLANAPFAIYELIESMRLATIIMGSAVTIVGSVLGVVLARALASPLNAVAQTSAQIARGNLSARVSLQREDEIGQLGMAFDLMAAEMSSLVNQLETRVAERTRDLEKRATQIRTAAEIGSAAAKLHNLDILLAQVTQLISERFGYYHTGIFLLDERKEFAVLRAANSTGGRRMLTRGHRLKVAEVGIVGYVTGSGNPRIALDVGSDAVFFDNPDLPNTRSEMALPLTAGGQILGALDVQSTEENAFNQDDVNALQVLADQISVSIENARLFDENQNALETIRRAYGDVSQAAWQKMQRAAGTLGFLSTAQGNLVRLTNNNARMYTHINELVTSEDGMTLSVPMKVRGQSIGMIRLSKPRNSPPWSAEEISVVNTLTDQVSGTLESARLYQEAQIRAATERQTTSIVNQIRSSTAMDSILQNTIRELGKAFNASRTFITINIPESDGDESASLKQSER
jgi:GAF domain-containing protein/HAMP domain-containing protein